MKMCSINLSPILNSTSRMIRFLCTEMGYNMGPRLRELVLRGQRVGKGR